MYQKSYFNFSPTKVRKNSMVKGNHIRNYTSDVAPLKESSSSYLNTHSNNSNKPNQTHSYIKLSTKPQKTETEIEEFSKELQIRPRKESYIEKFSPKKKRSILEV
jgi:hypothetical protein